MAASSHQNPVTGLILAGGQAQRLGGIDKGLAPLGHRPMIAHVLARFRPQVSHLIISANRNQREYARFGGDVISDHSAPYRGPLAGIASGVEAAITPYVAVVPCDAPRLPLDLVARLFDALTADATELAVVHDGTRLQPVFALLARALLPDLLNYLRAGGRRVDHWLARHRLATACFADQPGAFLNINDPDSQRAFEHDPTGSLRQ